MGRSKGSHSTGDFNEAEGLAMAFDRPSLHLRPHGVESLCVLELSSMWGRRRKDGFDDLIAACLIRAVGIVIIVGRIAVAAETVAKFAMLMAAMEPTEVAAMETTEVAATKMTGAETAIAAPTSERGS